MREDEAFEQGIEAAEQGKSLDDNPHTDDELHYQWLAGFMGGEKNGTA